MVRTAIILAAGMGVRLKERGRLTPKGCLCLGEKSILEESIVQLLAVGIQRIVIVTGYLAEQFEPLEARYRGAVQLVDNPHFAESGSMYLFAVLCPSLRGRRLLAAGVGSRL